MSKYYIVQSGFALFGIGETVEGAVADLNEWASPADPYTTDDVGDEIVDRTNGWRHQYNHGDMVICDDRNDATEVLGGDLTDV